MSPRNVVRVIGTSVVFLLLGQVGYGQATGTAPARPPAGNGGAVPNPGTVTPPTGTPNTTTTNGGKTPPGYAPPIFLTGRVALENGSPPPEPATIERICNGQSHAEGYSDSHGNFGIQLGNETGVFQDASEETSRSAIPGGMPATGSGSTVSSGSGASGTNSAAGATFSKYQNCEIRAKLAGYRSQSILLADHRALDDPNIGTILLHKEGGETGTTVSANSLAAPKESRRAYERGMQAVKKNKSDDASKEFEKAVELYPGHAEAWFELGRIQANRGQVDAARQSLSSAIQADPKFVNPYVQLSILALEAKKWQELGELTDRAMHLDSFDYPQLFLFNAVANYNLHKFPIAETSIKQAVRLDTQHRFPDIQHLMGLLLILHKDYPAAAEQFRAFLKMAPDNPEAPAVRKQLAEMDRMTTQSADATSKDK